VSPVCLASNSSAE